MMDCTAALDRVGGLQLQLDAVRKQCDASRRELITLQAGLFDLQSQLRAIEREVFEKSLAELELAYAAKGGGHG